MLYWDILWYNGIFLHWSRVPFNANTHPGRELEAAVPHEERVPWCSERHWDGCHLCPVKQGSHRLTAWYSTYKLSLGPLVWLYKCPSAAPIIPFIAGLILSSSQRGFFQSFTTFNQSSITDTADSSRELGKSNFTFHQTFPSLRNS